MIYAHTPNSKGEWHALSDHLAGTARRAESFAQAFGAGDFSKCVGLLHDVGKASCVFASYLKMCSEQGDAIAKANFPNRDHKMVGATIASDIHKTWGPLLATTILGHHGGMPDLSDAIGRIGEASSDPSLRETRANASVELDLAETIDLVHPEWLDSPRPQTTEGKAAVRDIEMYMRFVFSTLVDADWLDTEAHFSPKTAGLRGTDRDLTGLLKRFNEYRQSLIEHAHRSVVNTARAEIYDQVMQSVDGLPPGLYKLSTPTGSGKTLLALGWALRHAQAQGLRRIVTAVPFISVTDQVATVYRECLDRDNDHVVLEHHSQVAEDSGWQRLAAENWDSPVVVTTTVRLFESIFSNRPSDCRRLHRLANSIIVLDEVQALPVDVLEPVVDALRTLVAHFGATVLLLTATQPTLQFITSSGGLTAMDLLPDLGRWEGTFKRTRWKWMESLDHNQVASLMKERTQCLCIVNTISDAESITRALADENSLHLTTRLRPADRRDRLEEIQRRLRLNLPCRVVATQLVEAGVDLDFPTVFRALAPLPSLVQADGRCNRSGSLETAGETIIFDLKDGGAPSGSYYTVGRPITLALRHEEPGDPWTSGDTEEWYRRLLTDPMSNPDSRKVQTARENFNYAAVAKQFRMIDNDSRTVVVPWSSDDPRSEQLQSALQRIWTDTPCGVFTYRTLQDASVSLRVPQVEHCLRNGLVQRIGNSDLFEWIGHYDRQLGVTMTSTTQKDLIL